MIKKERAIIILRELNKLYPEPPIPLNHTNAFTLLIAVVLSAQSTDKKVNELTKDLFKIADSPHKMVKLGIENIYIHIKQLGLSKQKSKNTYLLSKMIIENFEGKVPNTFEKLESLPGVGHKTASVIMSQVFKIPSFPVDTHIHRLSQRWGLSKGENVLQTEKDLKKYFLDQSGINYICKSYFLGGNIAQLEVVMGQNVLCVKSYIQIEKRNL